MGRMLFVVFGIIILVGLYLIRKSVKKHED